MRGTALRKGLTVFQFMISIVLIYERIKRAYLNHPAVVGATASRATPDVTSGNLYAQFETARGEMQNASLHYYVVIGLIWVFGLF